MPTRCELERRLFRYALDSENSNAKSPEVALDCSIEGLSGISIRLEESKGEIAGADGRHQSKPRRQRQQPIGGAELQGRPPRKAALAVVVDLAARFRQNQTKWDEGLRSSFDDWRPIASLPDPRSYRADLWMRAPRWGRGEVAGSGKWAQELFDC